MTEYIELNSEAGRIFVRCSRCEHQLGERFDSWKASAIAAEHPLKNAGTLMAESNRFVLREFYCPGCGTILDVEVVLKGSPMIVDELYT